jgi:hypothetical protein
MDGRNSKRRGRAFVVLLVLVFAILVVIGLVSAFQLGVSTGMASAGIGLVAYHVPAIAFDWPRPTMNDIFAFFGAVFDWVMDLFSF